MIGSDNRESGDRPPRQRRRRRSLGWHLLRAAPVIVAFAILTTTMSRMGWFQGLESPSLDSFLLLNEPTEAAHVVIVGIDEADYRDLFKGSSPLDPEKVRRIIEVVAAGDPAVIGVDLDSSDGRFLKLQMPDCSSVPIVWAQDGVVDEERGWLEPQKVWGKHAPHGLQEGCSRGLAVMIEDRDGIVRRYRRAYKVGETVDAETPQPVLYTSFPTAVLRAYANSGNPTALDALRDQNEDPLILNFFGTPDRFPVIEVRELLSDGGESWTKDAEAWRTAGPLKDKIVLVGGFYRAARDKYVTPVGAMHGVQLMAQVIDTELAGKAVRSPGFWLMVGIDLALGFVLAAIYYWWRDHPARALWVSLGVGLVLLPAASYVAFRSSAYWVNFMPMAVGVIIAQLYDMASGRQGPETTG